MFKETVTKYLEDKGIAIRKVESESEMSLVYHLSKQDTDNIAEHKEQFENDLNALVEVSNMFGMNVAIIESNELEE